MKVGVLGSTGFLGMNLVDELISNNINYVGGSRRLNNNENVNAASSSQVLDWLIKNEITHVVCLSAMCGGIGLNKKHPYKLWSETTKITSSVIDACVEYEVDKLVMIGTVCSYASECPVPFTENNLMHYGMPEETNMAYGFSKLNGLIGAQAATKEFGMNITSLIPVNMYGRYDHFDLENSHVIPALINKIDKAIENNLKKVKIWGDGTASREFMHAKDCSRAIIKSLSINTGLELINIGTGYEITIKDLVVKVGELMGYEGLFEWESSEPNGQMRRCLDINKAVDILNWKPNIRLEDGLKDTVEWYRENKDNHELVV